MNRRKFLKFAASGIATASVVGTIGLTSIAPPTTIDAVIGCYADYCSFSDLALATAIDEQVQFAAIELGRRAGPSIDRLYLEQFS